MEFIKDFIGTFVAFVVIIGGTFVGIIGPMMFVKWAGFGFPVAPLIVLVLWCGELALVFTALNREGR